MQIAFGRVRRKTSPGKKKPMNLEGVLCGADDVYPRLFSTDIDC